MLKWLKSTMSEEKAHLDNDILKDVPRHVAIIMDGNGRWAKSRSLPRIAGHKEGMNVVKNITKCASKLGVQVLTLYAFSTENWKRPKDEVDFLMKLPMDFLGTFLPDLQANNVRVEVVGQFDALPIHTQNALNEAREATKENTGLILNFALNYGGRDELVLCMQNIAKSIENGDLKSQDIDEDVIQENLMTSHLPDPDLLIRTSGEIRISNFLLWQIAYSELIFVDQLWPDFSEDDFISALVEYQNRSRRFGGI